MITMLTFLNVLLAAMILVGYWRSFRFRSSIVAQMVALALAIGLGTPVVVLAMRVDAEAEMPLRTLVASVVLAVIYVPFLIMLLVNLSRGLTGLFSPRSDSRRVTGRGEFHAASGDFRRAARAFRRDLARNPDDVEARLKLAEALVQLGDLEDAVQTLRVAATQLYDDQSRWVATVLRTAQVLADLLGEYKAAAVELDIIRKRLPGSDEAALAQQRITQYMTRV